MTGAGTGTSWDDRERAFERHPVREATKWVVGAGLVILVAAAILTPFGWGFAWLREGSRITGPGNVREQNTAIISDWESLQATVGNVCDLDRGIVQQTGDPTLVENPAFAYRAQYRRIKADYDRRMANLFEAQAVRDLPLPSNLRSYPRVAPSLNDMQAEAC